MLQNALWVVSPLTRALETFLHGCPFSGRLERGTAQEQGRAPNVVVKRWAGWTSYPENITRPFAVRQVCNFSMRPATLVDWLQPLCSFDVNLLPGAIQLQSFNSVWMCRPVSAFQLVKAEATVLALCTMRCTCPSVFVDAGLCSLVAEHCLTSGDVGSPASELRRRFPQVT